MLPVELAPSVSATSAQCCLLSVSSMCESRAASPLPFNHILCLLLVCRGWCGAQVHSSWCRRHERCAAASAAAQLSMHATSRSHSSPLETQLAAEAGLLPQPAAGAVGGAACKFTAEHALRPAASTCRRSWTGSSWACCWCCGWCAPSRCGACRSTTPSGPHSAHVSPAGLPQSTTFWHCLSFVSASGAVRWACWAWMTSQRTCEQGPAACVLCRRAVCCIRCRPLRNMKLAHAACLPAPLQQRTLFAWHPCLPAVLLAVSLSSLHADFSTQLSTAAHDVPHVLLACALSACSAAGLLLHLSVHHHQHLVSGRRTNSSLRWPAGALWA